MCSYCGGKQGIGKEIAQVITEYVTNETEKKQMAYWEPFVGMCGVMKHVSSTIFQPRYGSDVHGELIQMWQKLQLGWKPPKNITETIYKRIKENKQADPALRAFVGHGYGFGGQYFGSFKPRFSDYDRERCGIRAYNGVMKTLPYIQSVQFHTCSYDESTLPYDYPDHSLLIYCDPPYQRTIRQAIGNTKVKFDNDAFWEWVRNVSKHQFVIVSENTAPNDFISIWSKDRHLRFNNHRSNKSSIRADGTQVQKYISEQLFVYKQ